LLAAKFASCQLVVVTHDERFFWYLKELLAPADWHFTRLTGPRTDRASPTTW